MSKAWCWNCEIRDEEECGNTGAKVYDDSYCGVCTPGNCDDCQDPYCEHSPCHNTPSCKQCKDTHCTKSPVFKPMWC
jgi:hypothetical protein